MRILNIQKEGIKAAVDAAVFMLQTRGLVIYPTETTYGVGVDVEDEQAVQKLLDYKGKRDGKPISIAVATQEMATRYVKLNQTARKAYETFLPGPVTIISTGTNNLAQGIASTEGTVGIRIPKYDLVLQILAKFGHGMTATGANVSNKKRPYSITDILSHTTKKQQDCIDLILDAGELPHNPPSTVIDTTLDDLVILRSGALAINKSEAKTTRAAEETIQYCTSISSRYRSYYGYTPVIFALEGEMGAGKTHAVKGLAQGLGIGARIVSPTYIFASEHTFEQEGQVLPFIHVDAWRLKGYDQLIDIGLETFLQHNAVIAIEWSEKFTKELEKLKSKAKIIFLRLDRTKRENERTISLMEA